VTWLHRTGKTTKKVKENWDHQEEYGWLVGSKSKGQIGGLQQAATASNMRFSQEELWDFT